MNEIFEFRATAHNQYGLEVGYGYGHTSEEALSAAQRRARKEIAEGNPHWKWRIAKVRVQKWGRPR